MTEVSNPSGAQTGRHRLVIVGGGAGGLELAARLGRRLGPDAPIDLTLIDAALTHVWKPQLHELAAGTLGGPDQETDYLQQAQRHGFRFHLGRLETMDRTARQLWLAPLVDDDGHTVAPRRAVPYDTVVLALGSVVNDFGTPGVREHAVALDTADDARRFHRRLLSLWARNELQAPGAGARTPVRIAIVGGGATGVELAAELMETLSTLAGFVPHLGGSGPTTAEGLPVRIHLLEAGPRLLAALPETVAAQAQADLQRRGIDVRTGVKVTGVTADSVQLGDDSLPADLTVWAAGIRGPQVLAQLDGLALTRSGQLVVGPTMQTPQDPRVLAIGDCAWCTPQPGGPAVPPRAQAAHQQAELLARALPGFIRGQPLPAFRYDDKGSLVSIGRRHAVGRVATPGGAGGSGFNLDGLLARWAYWGLQRQHMATLHGLPRTVLATVGGWLTARTVPPVKLH